MIINLKKNDFIVQLVLRKYYRFFLTVFSLFLKISGLIFLFLTHQNTK